MDMEVSSYKFGRFTPGRHATEEQSEIMELGGGNAHELCGTRYAGEKYHSRGLIDQTNVLE